MSPSKAQLCQGCTEESIFFGILGCFFSLFGGAEPLALFLFLFKSDRGTSSVSMVTEGVKKNESDGGPSYSGHCLNLIEYFAARFFFQG